MSRAMLLALLAGTAVAAGPDAATSAQERVLADRIVAVIDGSPIAASEVAFEAELRARVRADGTPDRWGRLLREPVEPLEAVLFERILRRLPRLEEIAADDAQVELRLRALAEGADFDPWLARWGLDRARLRARLVEADRLDRLIEVSVQVSVSEEEQRAYYERYQGTIFGGRPWEQVQADVAQRVYALAFDRAYNDWRSALRAQADKRYLGR